jgi:hypothetical protein
MSTVTSEIGTFETYRRTLNLSAYRGRPEVTGRLPKRRFSLTRNIGGQFTVARVLRGGLPYEYSDARLVELGSER